MRGEGAEGLQNKSDLGTVTLIQMLGLGTQIPSKTREKLIWGYLCYIAPLLAGLWPYRTHSDKDNSARPGGCFP